MSRRSGSRTQVTRRNRKKFPREGRWKPFQLSSQHVAGSLVEELHFADVQGRFHNGNPTCINMYPSADPSQVIDEATCAAAIAACSGFITSNEGIEEEEEEFDDDGAEADEEAEDGFHEENSQEDKHQQIKSGRGNQRSKRFAPKRVCEGQSFPFKLWHLMSDVNFRDVIHFSLDGTCIVIPRELAFVERVLRRPDQKIFKTENMKSFVRQLNLYGFVKIQLEREQCFDFLHECQRKTWPDAVFQNSNFVKDKPELLEFVKRRCQVKQNKQQLKAPKQDSGSKVLPNMFTAQYAHLPANIFNTLQQYGYVPVSDGQTKPFYFDNLSAQAAKVPADQKPSAEHSFKPEDLGMEGARATKRKLNFTDESKDNRFEEERKQLRFAPEAYSVPLPPMLPMPWAPPSLLGLPNPYYQAPGCLPKAVRSHDQIQLTNPMTVLPQPVLAPIAVANQYPPQFLYPQATWGFAQPGLSSNACFAAADSMAAVSSSALPATGNLTSFSEAFYPSQTAVNYAQPTVRMTKNITPPMSEEQSRDEETPVITGIQPLPSGSSSPSSDGSHGRMQFNAFSPLSAFCASVFHPFLQSSPLSQESMEPARHSGIQQSECGKREGLQSHIMDEHDIKPPFAQQRLKVLAEEATRAST